LGGGDKIPVSTSSSKARQYFEEGRDLAERLRQPEAHEKFQQAVAEDSQFALGYLALAQTSPSPKEFFANFDRAKSLAEHASEGERLMIQAVEAATNGDPTLQGEYLSRLVALYPNDERVYDQLGNYYFAQQQYDSAVALYTRANQLNPDYSPPYNMLGYSYRFQGNYDAAERSFRKYMELIPDDPNPYDSYADLLTKMGRFEESIENYRKALEVNANFTPSYVGIATNFNFLGRYAEARQGLKEFYSGLADDNRRRTALFSIAVSYAYEGLLDSALVVFEEMYKLADLLDDAAARANDCDNMGMVLLHNDRPELAGQKFSESLSAVENSSLFRTVKDNARLDYTQRLSLVALWQGELERADSLAAVYLRKSTEAGNPFRIRAAYQALGMVALKKQDFTRAVSDLVKADRQQAYNLFRLAQAYEGLGDSTRADSLYREVTDFNQLNSLMYAFVRRQAMEKVTSPGQS